jgi:hypothetical protein
MLNREFSRVPSKLRLGRSCRGRLPSLSWVVSDRGAVTSFDDASFPVDDAELCRPKNWLRLLVVNFFESLCQGDQLESKAQMTTYIAEHRTILLFGLHINS